MQYSAACCCWFKKGSSRGFQAAVMLYAAAERLWLAGNHTLLGSSPLTQLLLL
jgi:hypothetical protein